MSCMHTNPEIANLELEKLDVEIQLHDLAGALLRAERYLLQTHINVHDLDESDPDYEAQKAEIVNQASVAMGRMTSATDEMAPLKARLKEIDNEIGAILRIELAPELHELVIQTSLAMGIDPTYLEADVKYSDGLVFKTIKPAEGAPGFDINANLGAMFGKDAFIGIPSEFLENFMGPVLFGAQIYDYSPESSESAETPGRDEEPQESEATEVQESANETVGTNA